MRTGLATGGLGLALLIAAGAFDAEPLFVPAVALILLPALMWVWVWAAARGAVVARELPAGRVLEDDPFDVRLSARAGAVRFPGGRIVDGLLPEPFSLTPGRRIERVLLRVRFSRRGRRELAPAAVEVVDPLGLASRRVMGTGPSSVLVLPRPGPVTAPGGGADGTLDAAGLRLAGAARTEVDGLRPHRPGTPASRIHWPALARGAGLLERRLRPEGEGRPLVALDASSPSSPEDLDAAVRAAASLCLALAPGEGCALLLPGDRRPLLIGADLGAWPVAHARLAVVAEGSRLALTAATVSLAGSLFLVRARPAPSVPHSLRADGLAFVVVPGEVSGRRAAFAVAGCHGYALRSGARAGRAQLQRTRAPAA